MPSDSYAVDALTAGFQSLCPLCDRLISVYYKDGMRRYWEHAGKEGRCPKSNEVWTEITGWQGVLHVKPGGWPGAV